MAPFHIHACSAPTTVMRARSSPAPLPPITPDRPRRLDRSARAGAHRRAVEKPPPPTPRSPTASSATRATPPAPGVGRPHLRQGTERETSIAPDRGPSSPNVRGEAVRRRPARDTHPAVEACPARYPFPP